MACKNYCLDEDDPYIHFLLQRMDDVQTPYHLLNMYFRHFWPSPKQLNAFTCGVLFVLEMIESYHSSIPQSHKTTLEIQHIFSEILS